MKGGTPSAAPGRSLAAGAPHAGRPPAADDAGLARVGHIDDREDMVGPVGKMDGGRGVAAGGGPDAVRSEAVDRRVLCSANVDRGDAVAEAMPDIGVAAMDHDLNAVAAAALVRMADDFDLAGCNGVHVSHSPWRPCHCAVATPPA